MDARAHRRGRDRPRAASAASVAGIRRLMDEGTIAPDADVVAVLTGHLLKDPDAVLKYHSGTLRTSPRPSPTRCTPSPSSTRARCRRSKPAACFPGPGNDAPRIPLYDVNDGRAQAEDVTMNIGILGAGTSAGTGPVVGGPGHHVLFGVRTPRAYQGAAARRVHRLTQAGTARRGRVREVVLLAVGWPGPEEFLPEIGGWTGKILIDATNRIGSPLPGPGESAAEDVARLAPGARVVKAFNTVGVPVRAAPFRRRSGVDVALRRRREAKLIVGDLADLASSRWTRNARRGGRAEALGALWVHLATHGYGGHRLPPAAALRPHELGIIGPHAESRRVCTDATPSTKPKPLHERGFKVTPQRTLLLQVLAGQPVYLDAEEISHAGATIRTAASAWRPSTAPWACSPNWGRSITATSSRGPPPRGLPHV